MDDIEPDHQAEDIDLDPLAHAEGEPEQAEERHLHAAAARGERGEFTGRQVILADRRRRQIDMKLRQRPRQIGGEGVAVRPRPQPVFVRERVGTHGLPQPQDQGVDSLPALVGDHRRAIAGPIPVGRPLARAQRGDPGPDAPADDLIARIGDSIPRLEHHPGVDAENPPPAIGPRGIKLDDGLGMLRRVGREIGAIPARVPPIRLVARPHRSDPPQHRHEEEAEDGGGGPAETAETVPRQRGGALEVQHARLYHLRRRRHDSSRAAAMPGGGRKASEQNGKRTVNLCAPPAYLSVGASPCGS